MTAPFTLVDPPAGLADVVQKTLDAIDFPWDRLQSYLQKNDVESIKITTPMLSGVSNTVTGLWDPASMTIYLGTQFTNWIDDVPFVLTHEIGHLVDAAVLTEEQHSDIIKVMHSDLHWSSGQLYGHNTSEMTHDEDWWNGNAKNYSARIYECFADEFVAAFAPDIWNGNKGFHQHFPRFVHWTDKLDSIREIVLRQPIPKPQEDPVRWTRGGHIDNALDAIAKSLHETYHWRQNHRKSKIVWAKVVVARHALKLARKSLNSIKPHRA